MSQRKINFTDGEIYHIFNRGTDKRTIFEENYDLLRFLECMEEFNTPEPVGSLYELSLRKKNGAQSLHDSHTNENRLVRIIAYCLNPNHYHFILEQLSEKGIEKFMHKLGTGYVMYFNNKYSRTGSLFQGKFKAKHVDTNDYLLHLSAYVNLNDQVHQLGGKASKLVKSRSSWKEYISNNDGLSNPTLVLDQFKSKDEYKKFALDSLELMLKKKDEEREIKMSEIEFE